MGTLGRAENEIVFIVIVADIVDVNVIVGDRLYMLEFIFILKNV